MPLPVGFVEARDQKPVANDLKSALLQAGWINYNLRAVACTDADQCAFSGKPFDLDSLWPCIATVIGVSQYKISKIHRIYYSIKLMRISVSFTAGDHRKPYEG